MPWKQRIATACLIAAAGIAPAISHAAPAIEAGRVSAEQGNFNPAAQIDDTQIQWVWQIQREWSVWGYTFEGRATDDGEPSWDADTGYYGDPQWYLDQNADE